MHLSASGLYLKLITGVSDTSLSKIVVFIFFRTWQKMVASAAKRPLTLSCFVS